jgi:hypothetical protein
VENDERSSRTRCQRTDENVRTLVQSDRRLSNRAMAVQLSLGK